MDKTNNNIDITELIEANKGILIKVCNTYCSKQADREDLAQEMIYRLIKGSHTYKAEYKFTTWMYKVALNVAISYNRSSKKRSSTIPLTETDIDIRIDSSEPSSIEEQIRLLHQQIGLLNDFDKALIILYFEEKSYREISEIVGITETNVATRVSRIKTKLKERLTNAKTVFYE